MACTRRCGPPTVFRPGQLHADASTHVVEGAEVLSERVVVLLVEACDATERVPAQLARPHVSLDAERGHDAVEVRFLTARPPAGQT